MPKSITITYFVHGTTTDNEKGISTGWNPGELSKVGKEQSVNLKELIKGKKFDVIFCSDLKRAVDTAEVVFGGKVPIIEDKRLRECNYGNLNGGNSKIVEALKVKHISSPFPNGESYKDVENRVRSLLKELLENYAGKRVAFVSHAGPQLALDVIVKRKTWQQAMKEDWRNKEPKEWKPGWDYKFTEADLK